MAGLVVDAFRADAVGAVAQVQALVEGLCAQSSEFEAMRNENHVQSYGEGDFEQVRGLVAASRS